MFRACAVKYSDTKRKNKIFGDTRNNKICDDCLARSKAHKFKRLKNGRKDLSDGERPGTPAVSNHDEFLEKIN